ncbi:hypothetical protein PsorP6_014607 [Peronosclerospora sorghi]|uniref:Uncharacterized protein n=1 Tax=Peronosclerospora sorghi TaxID=230839 RepID=A0ACC0VTM5_9STRA|nr:hypothetical protein PsorP6_014607 [Peronosclerospora sorghi]
MLVLALLSVCVPLSLCVVPALARLTVFPLLSGLVHKFAATYLTDSINVEYSFGSFKVRGRRGAALASETLRGITISLFFVTLQSEFLKTLAFAKQGLAPVELGRVAIKQIVIHLATTWKVVVKVEGVTVDGQMVDPNADGVFEFQDAVAMKVTEAANWFNLLVLERTKTQLRDKQEQEEAARTFEVAPKAFGFKDRVLQQIAAQVDLHVNDVRVAITGLTPGAAAIDGHDDEGWEKDDEDASVVTDTSIPALLKPTRVSLMLKSMDLLTDVLHENPDEALQLVLTSEEILVEHGMSIKGLNICAGVVNDDDGNDEAVLKMNDSLKDNEEVGRGETSLLSFPCIDLKVRVAPILRLLGIVENIAPIPMKNRIAHLELVSASINRVSVTREPLVSLLRDLFVPFMDFQALVQSVRALEHDETVRKPISTEDEAFYVENFDHVDSNTLLSAEDKKVRHERLRALEAAMSLNEILKLRSQATGLAKYYRRDQVELTLADYIAVVQENAAKTCNVIFRAIQVTLRWDNLCIAFKERGHQVSEMVVTGFGVNLRNFTVAEGDDRLLMDVDMVLGQAMFVVNVGSSPINPASSTTKLMFADFSKLGVEADAITPPQTLTAYVSQFESGKRHARAAVNNVNLIVSAGALEHFLLYVDRLNTKTTQVLSTARPPSTPIVYSESSPASVQVAKSEIEAVAKNVSMSPFSLLGGMMLKLDVNVNDCRVVLLPTHSYSKSLDDLLSHEESESKSENCSTTLNGFLNLRGNEYHSFEVLNKMCESKIIFSEQLAEWIMRPAFVGRFWDLFESEARVSKHSLNDQNPLDVQKKLVRLLKNYDAANLVWDALVLPAMEESGADQTVCEWLLQPYTRCGGISEYQSAARVIAKKKRDGIFNAALEEAEHLVSKHTKNTNAVKKELRFTTNIKMGNVRLALTDTELPVRYCRGDFVIKDVKISMELAGKEIDEIGPVDWFGLATSANSDWTMLLGFKMSSSCYSDIASDMENIIEPWELVAGLSSGAGENGCSVLLEAAKRFQINVTPSVLKTYRALLDALDGEAQQNGLQKHLDNFRSSVASKKREDTDCLVQNFTGCNVTLKLNGSDKAIAVKAHDRTHIENGALKDGQTILDSLEIDQWGSSNSTLKLPRFGNASVGVSTADAAPSTLFVTVFSRLEGPRRQLIALKSNMYFCNHSSECYEVKYLCLGNEIRESAESPIIKLRPNERISLPLSLLMGITEFYARPEKYEHWIVKTSLNNDVVVSLDAIKELNEHEAKRETKVKQRRGGNIVYGETEETCTKVVKRLTPNVILRRWYLRSHFEWEIALLPPFVVRNSLPYEMEYRFVEYKSSSVKDMKTEFTKIDALLRSEDSHDLTDKVLSGVVEPGHDSEVSGVSGGYPGYLSVRLIAKKHDSGKHVTSSWSKPLLVMIHKGVEQFTTSREVVEPDSGLKFNIDRITLPSHPRLVRFSSPYWIVDNTSLIFGYASAKPGAKRTSLQAMSVCSSFSYPVMTSLEYDRLSFKPISSLNRRPKAWDALGNMPESAYKASSISKHAIENAQWSEPVNTTAINTMGEIVCGPSVFNVKLEGLYGIFEPGVSLTLSPRYFVQNRLNQKLYIQSFSSHDNDPQKVVDMFHRRSVDDVKQLSMTLNDGETRPLYHFDSLKHGESVEQSQRHVSFSFSEEWATDVDKKKWSFAIPINTAGDLYLQVYSSSRQRYLICQASVQVVDMYIYVVLTDVSCAPPYRIENYTPYTIDCAQLGESSIFSSRQKEMSATIKSGAWHAFAWFNPLSKERHVELRLSHPDILKTQTKKYDIDHVGYLDPITVWVSPDGGKQRAVELTAQVVVEECTRVLKVLEKELKHSRLESQNQEVDGDFQHRRTLCASSFDIAFNGFGFSLLDGFPQEVFFASVDVIKLQKASASLEWTFSVLHCQADNMLATAKFPVIMNPINAGYSDKSVGKEPEPFVKLVLVADLEARLGTYKLLQFTLSDIAVKVDIDYLVSLVKLLEPYLISDATMAHRSRITLENTLQRRAPSMPAMLVNGDGSIRTDLVYFGILRISSLSIDLEYSITRKDIVSSTDGGHSVIFGFLSQIVGLIGSNLSGSPTFSFSEIVIVRCFTTKQRLQNQLVANYVQQGVMQAYRLIGSADIIGNPIGLVEDLGSGVVEFLKITKGELTGDAHTRGEGVKVLGKTIVKSGASSVAKITGSLDKFVGEFADDDNDASGGSDPSSTDNVGVKFAKDLGRGFTGIFTKPVEGAMKGGVTGLVQGTVQGITGPGVVLLKGLTATSHNLALGVQSTVVDRSPFGGRRRKPKLVENGKLIAEFDEAYYKPTLLILEVLGAHGLNSTHSCDPMCVVRVDGVDVMKTAVVYNTVNPVWQEKTQLALTGKEEEVQFVVKDSYGGTVAKTIGKCILSMAQLQDDFKPPKYSSDLAQWVHTQVKPGNTKKNESHVIAEKDYPLVMLKKKSSITSSHAASLGEEKLQVFVTIVSLRDMVVTSSTDSGMLGLGNLGSSTPNISPYVSVQLGKNANRTNTTKMVFSKNQNELIGKALWGDSFTFPLTAKELKRGGSDSRLVVSLNDKSMIVDTKLGSATLDLDARIDATATTEELILKDQLNHPVGYLTVKVEVTGSATSSRSLSLRSMESSGDIVPLPSDAVKAGTIRVSCDFK